MSYLLEWDKTGEKKYATGTKNGVVYPKTSNGEYPIGEVWNGLIGVSASPTGGEATPFYADDLKYLNLRSKEEHAGTINCYMFPNSFDACLGKKSPLPGMKLTGQTASEFGFTYSSRIGNDVEFDEFAEIIHVIYGALAAPADQEHQSVNDTPAPEELSFEYTTTAPPIPITGYSPTAYIEFSSEELTEAQFAKLKEILYGKKGESPEADVPATLPLPDKLFEMLSAIGASEAGDQSAPVVEPVAEPEQEEPTGY